MRKLLVLPLLLFIVLAGCSNDLQTVANAENAIPQAVTLVANTSTQLVTQGSMSPAEGAAVAKILTDIVNANAHAVTATRAIVQAKGTLTAGNKLTISQVITPIIQEVQSSITSGDVYNIKNASAKLAITTSLSALVTTLQIIQAKVT